MNIDDIRQLADIMARSGLHLIEMTEKDYSLRLERDSQPSLPLPPAAPAPQTLAAQPPDAGDKSGAVDFNRVREIKSPMVGIFYPSPAPGSEPFVKQGGSVRKGDVLCIIEAMKMMNEIVAEEDGTVVDVCAQAGQLVEFSQVLFKLF